MDQPGVPVHEIKQALRELEVVNTLLGGYSLLLHALEKLDLPEGVVSIMDLGSGGGDNLRSIAQWAKKRNKEVLLTGVDWNATMTEYASKHSKAYPNISYKTANVFDDSLLEEKVHITTCSLFCHHFEKKELVELVKRLNIIATRAVVINDLHRHWFAYYSIKYITALFSKTYLVKYDAPLSVARAFTRRDWEEILQLAGITNYSLKWRWAWRWELIIYKQ
jgi:2-polyprenyl-3-methyl-5-hydroxy-6-metoxy-1,4-benzoquinol methylase